MGILGDSVPVSSLSGPGRGKAVPRRLVKLITQVGLSGEKGGTLLTNESESQTRLLLRPNEFSGRMWRGRGGGNGRMARKRKLPSRLS